MKWLKRIVIASAVAALVAGAVTLWVCRKDISQHFVIARAHRLVDDGTVTVVDLTGRISIPADNFDSSPQWSAVPSDFQVFHNVPFQIDGMLCLWGASNAKNGYTLPEEALNLGIQGKFETLYIYHATFYSSPPQTPVYEVVFRYEDGSSATNQIIYADDVFDWYSTGKSPANSRSRVAWRGQFDSNGKTQKLSFYLTALPNPNPDVEVTSVDLFSSKNDSSACIGGLTAGPAKLIH